jgi:type IV pilus assembly protein PilA
LSGLRAKINDLLLDAIRMQDLQAAVAALREVFIPESMGATPYAAANTSTVANLMRGGSVFTVTGVGATATLANSMRLLGRSAVTVTSSLLSAGALGNAYTISATNVSEAACPGLAAAAQRGAEVITINTISVKAAGGVYNGVAAAAACTLLDTNTFTFQAM